MYGAIFDHSPFLNWSSLKITCSCSIQIQFKDVITNHRKQQTQPQPQPQPQPQQQQQQQQWMQMAIWLSYTPKNNDQKNIHTTGCMVSIMRFPWHLTPLARDPLDPLAQWPLGVYLYECTRRHTPASCMVLSFIVINWCHPMSWLHQHTRT